MHADDLNYNRAQAGGDTWDFMFSCPVFMGVLETRKNCKIKTFLQVASPLKILVVEVCNIQDKPHQEQTL